MKTSVEYDIDAALAEFDEIDAEVVGDIDDAIAEFDALEASTIDDVGEVTAILVNPDQDIDSVLGMQDVISEHRDSSAHMETAVSPELGRILGEIESIAFANIADLYEGRQIFEECGLDEEGEVQYQIMDRILLKDFTKLPREITAAIQSIKIKKERGGDVIEVKMYDKIGSLEKLMRYHGAYARESEQRKDENGSLLDLLFNQVDNNGLPTPKAQ